MHKLKTVTNVLKEFQHNETRYLSREINRLNLSDRLSLENTKDKQTTRFLFTAQNQTKSANPKHCWNIHSLFFPTKKSKHILKLVNHNFVFIQMKDVFCRLSCTSV